MEKSEGKNLLIEVVEKSSGNVVKRLLLNPEKYNVCTSRVGLNGEPSTSSDLLDRLTDKVLEYAEVDGLPYINRGGDLPDVRVVVPDRNSAKLRDEMTEEIRKWIREVFNKE